MWDRQAGSFPHATGKKHRTFFHKKNNSTNYAKHLNEAGHSFGLIHDIMEILHYEGKGRHLNAAEKFHSYAQFAANNQLNDPRHIPPTRFSTYKISQTAIKKTYPLHPPPKQHRTL
jgi:hypothetical protein